VGGQVIGIASRDGPRAVVRDGERREQRPARNGRYAHRQDRAWIEPERAHGDERKQQARGWRLEHAPSRMAIRQLIAPNQRQEDRRIENVENGERPFGQPLSGTLRQPKTRQRVRCQSSQRKCDPGIGELDTIAGLRKEVKDKDEARDRPLGDGNGALAVDVMFVELDLQTAGEGQRLAGTP